LSLAVFADNAGFIINLALHGVKSFFKKLGGAVMRIKVFIGVLLAAFIKPAYG